MRTEGSLLLGDCSAARGLYDSRAVLEEVAREILYFFAAARPFGEMGVSLRENLIVGR